MNAYGRYVHIFFGVLLVIPLLIFASQAEVLIVAVFGAVAIFCAIAGCALIIRALAAPSLSESSGSPPEKKSMPSS